MKKFTIVLLATIVASLSLYAGNVITYTATEKLSETGYGSFDPNAFNVEMINHTFSNGVGTITFAGDVTSIGESTFNGCTGLTSITIPESVTSIGALAFYRCTGLTSITIPEGVTSVGLSAFEGCTGLTSVVWNAKSCEDFSNLNPFGDYSGAFSQYQPNITSIVFGNSVETIPAYICCHMKKLTSVTIGNSVTSIGEHAFSGCTGLTSITIPNSVTSIGSYTFYGCTGLTSITIPENVTSIGAAFVDCTGITSVVWNAKSCEDFTNDSPFYYSSSTQPKITSIIFGNMVKTIPAFICYGMEKLTTVTIGNGVTDIGDYAFSQCSGLTYVTINRVTNIGESAFSDCTSLTSIAIPNSATNIEGYAFNGCTNLSSVTLGNSVTSIGEQAFSECTSLSSITIPKSVTSIGDMAFTDCTGLTYAAIIGNGATSIGENAFTRCNALASAIIGDGVTSIGSHAFSQCSGLTSVTIGNNVMSIGNFAFNSCTSLTSIAIPESVTSIGNMPFAYCTGLTSITSYAIIPPKCSSTLIGAYTTIPIYIPCGTKNAYKKANGWNVLEKNLVEMFDYVLTITSQNEEMGSVQMTSESSCANNKAVFEAIANEGYHFKQWNDGNTDNPRTIIVTRDMTFVAEFVPATPVENVSADGDTAVRKVVRDGQVYILRNGKTYTVQGQEIRE